MPVDARDPLPARLARRDTGYLLFGLTPPRRSHTFDEAQRIADVTLDRLAGIDLDALPLYDIVDENERTSAERPFPDLPTLDPADFVARHLGAWGGSIVVYRCVGKYSEIELDTWLHQQDPERICTVFVGAASREMQVQTTLPQAQALGVGRGRTCCSAASPYPSVTPSAPTSTTGWWPRGSWLLLRHPGGLRRPSRAQPGLGLLLRMSRPRDRAGTDHLHPVGVRLAQDAGVLALAGVDVPRWMENALRHSHDTLAASSQQCLATARDLAAFCRSLGMPFGFNVESVSIRKAEIDAAVDLANRLRAEVL